MDDSLSLSLVWQAQFWCWPHTRTTLEKSHEQTQGLLFPVAASGLIATAVRIFILATSGSYLSHQLVAQCV